MNALYRSTFIIRLMRAVFLLLCFCLCHLESMGQTSGVRVIDSAGVVLSTHATLAAAYGAMPNPLTGPLVIEMDSTYNPALEQYPLTFTDHPGLSAQNQVTIRPDSHVVSIVHSHSVAMAQAMFVLDNVRWLTFDGRPGGKGSQRVWTIAYTVSNAINFNLLRGASNNQLIYLNIVNGGFGLNSRCINLSTAPFQAEGNSHNLIAYCVIDGGNRGILSSGTSAHPNRHNLIKGNIFPNVIRSAIWVEFGTGSMVIDSNSISSSLNTTTARFGIRFEHQSDTLIIRNNHIFDLDRDLSSGNQMRGILIASTAPSGSSNYSEIYNNHIALTFNGSLSTSKMGIEIGGSNLIQTKVYHNTIRIDGTITSGGASGTILSACFAKSFSANDTNSMFDVRNNIFVNERTGGALGAQHLVVAFSNTSGFWEFDHNTYMTNGLIGRFGLSTYTSLADFAAALGGVNELNGHVRTVHFLSATDLRLDTLSWGDLHLAAPFVPWIATDGYGHPRHPPTVYRGAHEAVPGLSGNCTGPPTAGQAIANPMAVCAGDSFQLSLSSGFDPEMQYQWQQMMPGALVFTNITGATRPVIGVVGVDNRQYRCIVSCVRLNLHDTSAAVSPNLTLALGTIGIQTTVVGATYTFTAQAGPSAVNFMWDFGDGQQDSGQVVSHSYAQNGPYDVRLQVSNRCFADSALRSIQVISVSTESISPLNTLQVYPNPVVEWVQLEAAFDIRWVHVYDLQGRELAQHAGPADGSMKLYLGDLPAAAYELLVQGRRGELARVRLVKLP